MPTVDVKEFGDTVVVDVDAMGDLMAATPLMKGLALEAGADALKAAFQTVWETDGHGTWPPKSQEAIEESGTQKLLLDSGELQARVDDRPGNDEDEERFVGWFDDIHRNQGVLENRESKPITTAELAAVHEFGHIQEGGRAPDTGLFQVPPRPWASLAADRHGDMVIDVVANVLGEGIEAFNMIPMPTASGATNPSNFMRLGNLDVNIEAEMARASPGDVMVI